MILKAGEGSERWVRGKALQAGRTADNGQEAEGLAGAYLR